MMGASHGADRDEGAATAELAREPRTEGVCQSAEGQALPTTEDAAREIARSLRGKSKAQMDLFPPSFDVRRLSAAVFRSRQKTMEEWIAFYEAQIEECAVISRHASLGIAELKRVMASESQSRKDRR